MSEFSVVVAWGRIVFVVGLLPTASGVLAERFANPDKGNTLSRSLTRSQSSLQWVTMYRQTTMLPPSWRGRESGPRPF